MLRRRIGIVSMVAGGVLCTFAGSRYVSGAIAQDRARSQWESDAARAAYESADRTLGRERATPLFHGAPVARLLIPRIALDEIVLEGVDDDAMNGGPGHYPGTPLPGQLGNSIVSAHRDRHFRGLGQLGIGDTIVTQSGSRTTRWVIGARRIVRKEDAVLRPTSGATLTLTTCWPIRYFGTAPDRLVLTAHPI